MAQTNEERFRTIYICLAAAFAWLGCLDPNKVGKLFGLGMCGALLFLCFLSWLKDKLNR